MPVDIETIPDGSVSLPISARLKAHFAIMRVDHSIKNIFIIPGIVVPLSVLHKSPLAPALIWNVLIGLASASLIAWSNYVLNEVLDAPFDRLHPTKCSRPTARGSVNLPIAYAQWIFLMLVGMALSLTISWQFACTAAALWLMGCLYNIPPIRTKDRVYIDVLSEAFNNPLRLLLGWFMVTSVVVPPVSLLISYWMIGCYLMALKRFSEYREIGDRHLAGRYRRSFQKYSEASLLSSVTFYASTAMLFFGAFIIRYRIELIFDFPLVALLMSTYMYLAFQPNSAVQNPEKLYREPLLMAETILMMGVMLLFLYVDIPLMRRIFSPTLSF